MITYEELLERMLGKVSSNQDKREGSIIWDAHSPVAVELQNLYIHADWILKMTSVATSEGTYLDELIKDIRGMTRIPASKAVVTGTFNIDVPIGSRYSGGVLNYVVTEKVSDGVFLMECETEGTTGNDYVGTLIPIEYIEGLQIAEITEISIPAVDTETDEAFRERFYESASSQAQNSNVAQYKQWCSEYPGVGEHKIFPLWNGKNTVKVSILNAENGIASDTLLENFQEFLDPGSTGLGNGAADIGAVVTVTTATAKVIDITVDVYLEDGFETHTGVSEAIEALFKKLAYTSSFVNFYEVAGAISACDSVARIANLKVNSTTEDVLIGDEEIPMIGTLNVQVVTA
jgi:uncharacterized phage protein gp47/JayE